jgi:glutamine amidotransferase
MQVVIIKYNAGNIQSVTYALERLGIEPVLSDEPEVIRGADKVIFPGVGEASTAMQYLRQAGLDTVIPTLKQPFLGVCLGLQLMCAHSEENDTDCLGVFDLRVKRFPRGDQKVPHMGWNLLHDLKTPLLADLPVQPYVYFVHSYYAEVGPHTIASSEYMLPFSAALHRDNFYATQFHPEKSGEVGAKLLENFIRNG